MKPTEWLTTEAAAVHLGFVKDDGAPNVTAFKSWFYGADTKTKRPKTYKLGRRLRFRRADLDRCVESR